MHELSFSCSPPHPLSGPGPRCPQAAFPPGKDPWPPGGRMWGHGVDGGRGRTCVRPRAWSGPGERGQRGALSLPAEGLGVHREKLGGRTPAGWGLACRLPVRNTGPPPGTPSVPIPVCPRPPSFLAPLFAFLMASVCPGSQGSGRREAAGSTVLTPGCRSAHVRPGWRRMKEGAVWPVAEPGHGPTSQPPPAAFPRSRVGHAGRARGGGVLERC